MLKSEKKCPAVIKPLFSLSAEVSAHLDSQIDSLPNARNLSQLPKEQIQKIWYSYHLTGAVLRKELPDLVDLNFVKRVEDALEKELKPITEEEWLQLIHPPALPFRHYWFVYLWWFVAGLISVILILFT